MPERRLQSNAWLYEQMQIIRREQIDAHARLRTDMLAGFEKLLAKIEEHTEDDRRVENRVLTLENGMQYAKDKASRRATLMSVLIAAMFTGFWKVIELWFRKGP